MLLPGFLIGLVVMFLHLLSAVQLAPENSNRMLPVRVVLAVLYGLFLYASTSGLLFLMNSHAVVSSHEKAFFIFFFLYVLVGPFVFTGFVLIFICERENYSARMGRSIPSEFLKRLLCFPFYTGAANAMVWAILFLLLKAVFVRFFCSALPVIFPPPLDSEEIQRFIVSDFSFNLLFFDYAATTLLLYNLVLHRYYSREWNWAPLTAFYTILAALGRARK